MAYLSQGPGPKKAFKSRSGAPKRGKKWAEDTSGKIPNPTVVPIAKAKPAKLKPMRAVSGGSYGSGAPRKTVRGKARSL